MSDPKKLAALLFLAFITLFAGRLVASLCFDSVRRDADWLLTPMRETRRLVSLEFLASGNYRKDYSNNAAAIGFDAFDGGPGDLLGNLEVYTREARVGAATNSFDADVERALSAISDHRGDVRLERAEGTQPRRTFQVVVRAPVEEFDACVSALHTIGEVQSSSVTKEDVSETARQRFAERAALKQYAESLTELRGSDGEVRDRVELEGKIREVRQQIRSLDVALGEFVKDASYHNINYTLAERVVLFVDEQKFPLWATVVGAFAWTFGWYSLVVALAAIAWLTVSSARLLLAR